MELIVTDGDRQETLIVESMPEGGFSVRWGDRHYLVDAAAVSGGLSSLLVRTATAAGLPEDGGRREVRRQWEVAVRSGEEGRFTVSPAGPLPATTVTVMDPLALKAKEALAAAGRNGPHRASAYMPGRVIALLAEEGAQVEAGQGILVLEAMKMENEIAAESSGVVRRILVQPGQTVDSGDPLFEIE